MRNKRTALVQLWNAKPRSWSGRPSPWVQTVVDEHLHMMPSSHLLSAANGPSVTPVLRMTKILHLRPGTWHQSERNRGQWIRGWDSSTQKLGRTTKKTAGHSVVVALKPLPSKAVPSPAVFVIGGDRISHLTHRPYLYSITISPSPHCSHSGAFHFHCPYPLLPRPSSSLGCYYYHLSVFQNFLPPAAAAVGAACWLFRRPPSTSLTRCHYFHLVTTTPRYFASTENCSFLSPQGKKYCCWQQVMIWFVSPCQKLLPVAVEAQDVVTVGTVSKPEFRQGGRNVVAHLAATGGGLGS